MSENQDIIGNGISTRSVFLALAAAAFVSGANLRLFDALLPSVAEDFGVSVTATAIVVTVFTLAYGLFQIVSGPLGDRLGKLRVISAATLLVGLTSLGSAFAPTLGALTVLRFATGVGAAAIVPLSIAWIGDNSSYEMRQVVLGRFMGFLLLGQVLGPAVGGTLTQLLGWREVFYLLAGIFSGVSAVLFIMELKSPARSVPPVELRILGTYAKLLRDGWVRTVMITAFLEGAFFFGALAYAGAYLKMRFGLPYSTIGLVLACLGLGGITYSLLIRRLRSMISEKGFVGLAALILLSCYVTLPLLPVWQVMIPLFGITGFGFYLFHNTLQTRATEMAPQSRGMAIAVFAFSLFIGQASGVAANGLLIDFIGYRWTFTVAGVLLAVLGRWFVGRLNARSLTL